MDELTKKEYWGNIWKDHKPRKMGNCNFFDLFRKYLPVNPEMKCLEVGCTPGGFLVAFNKNFGYKVYGVDQCGMDATRKNLEFNEVENYELFESDFLKWEINEKFDVVSSFGYIEHFKNPALHIKKMVDLLAKDSYLVMSIPCFGNMNYITHSLFDRENTNWKKIHNFKIMNLGFFEKTTEEFDLEPVYLGHYRFFSYWHKSKSPLFYAINAPISGASVIFNKITDAFMLNQLLANRLTSPFLVLIAKKK